MDGNFDLLTVKEVAHLLHCSKAHICNLVAGRVHGCAPIPALRLGRRMLVRRQALAVWIEHSERAPANDNVRPANDNLNHRQNEARKRG
jgi:excisionase family DNA binding protein